MDLTALLEQPTFGVAFLASLGAGVATGAGALPVLALGFRGRPEERPLSDRSEAGLMGLGAGVMLAASFLSLLLPAMDLLGAHGALGASFRAVGGLLVGAVVISLLNRWTPHVHFIKDREAEVPSRLSRTWLFVLAITLHNVPEGLAVGVGVGSGQAHVSLPVILGIALQNMPEGLVVAVSLLREGYTRRASVGVALLSGLVEPLASVLGFAAVSFSATLLPYGLAFAAGAMLYVVSDEIIPESHRGDAAEIATWGTLIGFCLMTVLDKILA